VPDSPDFQLTSFTIAAWVNVSANSWEVFFRGDNRTEKDPYSLAMDNNGNIGIGIQSDTAIDSVYAPISFHEWHQVTATLDGETHQFSLYIDGALVGQKTTTVVPLLALDPSQVPGIGIGNVQDAFDFPFLGSIDEVLLYDQALTSEELATVFGPQ
jgi:hypothetical protein